MEEKSRARAGSDAKTRSSLPRNKGTILTLAPATHLFLQGFVSADPFGLGAHRPICSDRRAPSAGKASGQLTFQLIRTNGWFLSFCSSTNLTTTVVSSRNSLTRSTRHWKNSAEIVSRRRYEDHQTSDSYMSKSERYNEGPRFRRLLC